MFLSIFAMVAKNSIVLENDDIIIDELTNDSFVLVFYHRHSTGLMLNVCGSIRLRPH
jgi:hypothetical protein